MRRFVQGLVCSKEEGAEVSCKQCDGAGIYRGQRANTTMRMHECAWIRCNKCDSFAMKRTGPVPSQSGYVPRDKPPTAK
jgi:hypothetical protein